MRLTTRLSARNKVPAVTTLDCRDELDCWSKHLACHAQAWQMWTGKNSRTICSSSSIIPETAEASRIPQTKRKGKWLSSSSFPRSSYREFYFIDMLDIQFKSTSIDNSRCPCSILDKSFSSNEHRIVQCWDKEKKKKKQLLFPSVLTSRFSHHRSVTISKTTSHVDDTSISLRQVTEEEKRNDGRDQTTDEHICSCKRKINCWSALIWEGLFHTKHVL